MQWLRQLLLLVLASPSYLAQLNNGRPDVHVTKLCSGQEFKNTVCQPPNSLLSLASESRLRRIVSGSNICPNVDPDTRSLNCSYASLNSPKKLSAILKAATGCFRPGASECSIRHPESFRAANISDACMSTVQVILYYKCVSEPTTTATPSETTTITPATITTTTPATTTTTTPATITTTTPATTFATPAATKIPAKDTEESMPSPKAGPSGRSPSFSDTKHSKDTGSTVTGCTVTGCTGSIGNTENTGSTEFSVSPECDLRSSDCPGTVPVWVAKLNETLEKLGNDSSKAAEVLHDTAAKQDFNDTASVKQFTGLLTNQLAANTNVSVSTVKVLLGALGSFANKGLWARSAEISAGQKTQLTQAALALVQAVDDIGQGLVGNRENFKFNESGIYLSVNQLQGRSASVTQFDGQTSLKLSTLGNPTPQSGAVVTALLDLPNLIRRLTPSNGSRVASKLVQASLYSSPGDGGKATKLPGASVLLRLGHLESEGAVIGVRRTCVYVDAANSGGGMLKDLGCRVVPELSDASTTACLCNHLSSYAVLVSPKLYSWDVESAQLLQKHSLPLQFLTWICLGLSIICLLLSCLTYLIARPSSSHASVERSVAIMHRTHNCLCASMLMSHALFLGGFLGGTDLKEVPCQILSSLTVYFFLAVFCWLLCEGFMCTKNLVIVMPKMDSVIAKVKFWHYCVLSSLAPALILTPILVFRRDHLIQYQANPDDDGTGSLQKPKYCWLSSELGTVWAFIGPVLFVCCVNLVVFAVILVKLMRRDLKGGGDGAVTTDGVSRSAGVADLAAFMRHQTKLAVTLSSILGLTWLLTVAFFFAQGYLLITAHYLFTLLNGLQGCFIFATQIAGRERMWDAWQRRLQHCACLPVCLRDWLERRRRAGRERSRRAAAGRKAGAQNQQHQHHHNQKDKNLQTQGPMSSSGDSLSSTPKNFPAIVIHRVRHALADRRQSNEETELTQRTPLTCVGKLKPSGSSDILFVSLDSDAKSGAPKASSVEEATSELKPPSFVVGYSEVGESEVADALTKVDCI